MKEPHEMTDQELEDATTVYWDKMIADTITDEEDKEWTVLFLEEERRENEKKLIARGYDLDELFDDNPYN